MSPQADHGQLAEAVKELSDDQLEETLKQMGVDDVLREIFAGMQGAFVAERAEGEDSMIQYDIQADEDVKQYRMKIADGSCEASPGPAEDPRLTLQLGLVDFVRLIFDQVQGPQLFMRGRLKLKGDMMFAMQMQNFFKRDF